MVMLVFMQYPVTSPLARLRRYAIVSSFSSAMTAEVSIELAKAPYRSIDYMHTDELRTKWSLSEHVSSLEP